MNGPDFCLDAVIIEEKFSAIEFPLNLGCGFVNSIRKNAKRGTQIFEVDGSSDDDKTVLVQTFKKGFLQNYQIVQKILEMSSFHLLFALVECVF